MVRKPRYNMASTLGHLQIPKREPDNSPHLVVRARAGTGKTTTIMEGLKHLRGLPTSINPSDQQRAVWESLALSAGKAQSVVFVAFNKSIATELQRRVPQGVEAMTMHSMGFAAVRSAYGKVSVSEGRVDEILFDLYAHQYADIWDFRRKRPGLAPLVKELVGLCKMNLLEGTPDDCWRLISHHAIQANDSTVLSEAIDKVAEVLRKCADVDHDRRIDFDDMVWLPVINDLQVKRYDILLGDEVQDWNKCQQELAKKAGRRLVLVGDDRQAIYGFAGADAESMRRMETELSDPTSRGCVVLPLTVTRRCGKAIVEEAKKIVPDFEAHESNGPGEVLKMRLSGNETNDPSYRDAATPGDMVLCRLNAPLVSECMKFLKQGRKATIQGRDIGQGLVSTIKGTKAQSVEALITGVGHWLDQQVMKERAKKHPSEDRILALSDRHDCIVAFCEGARTVEDVLGKIQAIFTDAKDSPGIRLSSVHKAKGLEADRVFILQTEKARMPHPMAKTPWQKEQEMNLLYVAITRAIKTLVYVS